MEKKEIWYKAIDWWLNEGSYIDPDTSDVPYEDKFSQVAQAAYVAGFTAALQQPNAVDAKPFCASNHAFMRSANGYEFCPNCGKSLRTTD